MDYFNKITNINEARLIYRRLAMLNHPDLGGNPEVMARINYEYNTLKKSLIEPDNKLLEINPGDIVVINESQSIVVSVSENTFIARSKVTNRQAVFNLKTGICISNPKFKTELQKSITHVR